jgi:hypothetical protein
MQQQQSHMYQNTTRLKISVLYMLQWTLNHFSKTKFVHKIEV